MHLEAGNGSSLFHRKKARMQFGPADPDTEALLDFELEHAVADLDGLLSSGPNCILAFLRWKRLLPFPASRCILLRAALAPGLRGSGRRSWSWSGPRCANIMRSAACDASGRAAAAAGASVVWI